MTDTQAMGIFLREPGALGKTCNLQYSIQILDPHVNDTVEH